MTSITSGNSLAFSTQPASNATATQPTAPLPEFVSALAKKPRGQEDVCLVLGPAGFVVKA
jgi:hypothetical protein